MDAFTTGTYAHAFNFNPVSMEQLRATSPAIFASAAHERTSAAYKFISTERVLEGLMQAGFVPVKAEQSRTRKLSSLHAKHMIRLRRRFETVQLADSLPELVFLNAHDGTSAYQLQVGVYRVVCTNGLIVSNGCCPGFRVPHRGDVVDDVVAAALDLSERFVAVAMQIEQMERCLLDEAQQLKFAEGALALRYPGVEQGGMAASRLLTVRRAADHGRDLWRVMNTVQDNLLNGGLQRRSATGRLQRMRRISAIRENVRLNSGLWDLAAMQLGA